MKRKVQTHSFNGIKYDIDVDGYRATCDPPEGRDPCIALPNGLAFGNSTKARENLLDLLHEIRHAQDFSLYDKTVEREAKEIRDLLWRLGYRRKK